MKVHEHTTMIRERHLDTFGHVNNSQYLILFEEARWEMITSRGYGMREVHQNQVGTVVMECQVRFKRELRLRETIRIRTWVGELRSRLAKIQHELLNEQGEVAAEATFTMGCFDLRARKLIQPTPEWLKAIGALE